MVTHERYGVARTILIGMTLLLVAGVAGSMWLSSRASADAERAAVQQARAIASQSLPLVLSPTDFHQPVSQARAEQLTPDVSAVVMDPSDYTSVTVWSEDGVILYSTEVGRIGNELAGERTRIATAIGGKAVTKESGGEFSVMVPLGFGDGIGPDLAVELVRPGDRIASASGPWRTSALFLLLPLAATVLALYGVGRMQTALRSAPGHLRAEPGRLAPALQPRTPEPARSKIEVPTPGLQEESDARKMAEDRARAAEERLALLQEQYRKSLDDMQTLQQMAREAAGRPDPRMEERALRAEGLVRTLEGQVKALEQERGKLEERLEDATHGTRSHEPDPDQERRILDAVQEAIGLRAELEGAHAQLSITKRELNALTDAADRSSRLQEDIDGLQLELRHTKDALLSTREELDGARAELKDARTETRTLRGEEQRATVLQDELRAARAELASASASHRAELVEREVELERQVRAAREQFQGEIAELEASYREKLSAKDAEVAERIARIEADAGTTGDELEASREDLRRAHEQAADLSERLARAQQELDRRAVEVDGLRAEITAHDERGTATLAELDGAKADLSAARGQLASAEEALAGTQAELLAAQSGSTEAGERAARAEHENRSLSGRIERMGAELEAAAAENADLNRKLQELEARRALELADDQGRAEMDELLRVTQERLAGQTEKLMAAEDRIHELERDMAARTERLDEVEAQLRQHQMSDALREIRPPAHAEGAPTAPPEPLEDRRASTPFVQELAVDAKRSLTRIMGIAQVLKHKKDAKDHAQLVKQLSTLARRLDHTVGDLAEADSLAQGTVELTVKRTNVEALVERVVEESGVGEDHDVRLDMTSFSISVDPQRTEQIVGSLIRNAGERTPGGKNITVRLSKLDGGALLSVEDPEPSSDASMSPVVRRFAEAQGGWARVEGRDGGGSAFRVFLPDASPKAEPDEVQIVVEGSAEEWEPGAAQLLVQDLRRLAERD